MFRFRYEMPKGFSNMIMMSDGENLTGLFFSESSDAFRLEKRYEERELPVFAETARWLDIYFGGQTPDFVPQYALPGLTPFRKAVVDIMNTIPFGSTMTYGEISKMIAAERGQEKMSAQAVGGAVGWNPICIIIPCHRVMGAKGKLTGYGGGIRNKIALLRHEGIYRSALSDLSEPISTAGGETI